MHDADFFLFLLDGYVFFSSEKWKCQRLLAVQKDEKVEEEEEDGERARIYCCEARDNAVAGLRFGRDETQRFYNIEREGKFLVRNGINWNGFDKEHLNRYDDLFEGGLSMCRWPYTFHWIVACKPF